MILSKDEVVEIQSVINGTRDDLSDATFDKLYEHFVSNGEMPYGTAKARDGDPHEWIGDRLEDVLKDFA